MGGSTYTNLSIDKRAFVAPGDYYFGVIVDPSNTFTEINEVNNVTISDNIDLTVAALTAPEQIGQSGTFKVNFTAINQSPINVTGYVNYRIVLSDDSIITMSDTVLLGRSFYTLAANSSQDIVNTITLPAAVALGEVLGDCHLGVIVDQLNNVYEADESNNTRSLAVAVIAP